MLFSTDGCDWGCSGDVSSSSTELLLWLLDFFVAESVSRRSSWQRWPIFRLIHRAHGLSCAIINQPLDKRINDECISSRTKSHVICYVRYVRVSLIQTIRRYLHAAQHQCNLGQLRTHRAATIYAGCRNGRSKISKRCVNGRYRGEASRGNPTYHGLLYVFSSDSCSLRLHLTAVTETPHPDRSSSHSAPWHLIL